MNRLPDALKRRHTTTPWRQIYGFRNIAAHAYEQIDLVRVWEIVEGYLPDLKAVIDQELEASDRPTGDCDGIDEPG